MATKDQEHERFRDRDIEWDVPTELSPEQLKRKRKLLGKTEKDLEDKTKEKAETVAKLNSDIKDLEDKRHKLIVEVDAGTENTKVTCTERFDFQKNKVIVLHNGEVVHTRAMAPEERRQMLNPPRAGEEKTDEDSN